MTRFTAYCILKRNSRKLIKNICDYGDNLEALSIVDPGFEYPDWDCRTVAEFLKKFCSDYTKAAQKADRQAKDQVMRDCGLVKVRGAVSGKVYWE